jgi:hypothetical protein
MTLINPESPGPQRSRRRSKIRKIKRILKNPSVVGFFVFLVAAIVAAGLSYMFAR